MKNPKKNLPIALVVGTAIIMAVYILYSIGLTGGASVDVLRTEGSPAAFKNLFGNVGGTVMNLFIVVSCLGTLNGLMLACTRSIYSVAVRGQGPKPQVFSVVDGQTNMPSNSGVLALLFCGAWYFYFYGANLTAPVFGIFSFDSSELPIITTYAFYIPIFIRFMIKEKNLSFVKRFLLPAFALIGAGTMVGMAIYAHGIAPYMAAKAADEPYFSFPVLYYLILFAVIMIIGIILMNDKKKAKK